jgi:hypothetical protein
MQRGRKKKKKDAMGPKKKKDVMVTKKKRGSVTHTLKKKYTKLPIQLDSST